MAFTACFEFRRSRAEFVQTEVVFD